jgi:hypothetical protein
MLPRLDIIGKVLLERRMRAEKEGWFGDIDGINLTLQFLRQKREQSERHSRVAPVPLGLPIVPRHY